MNCWIIFDCCICSITGGICMSRCYYNSFIWCFFLYSSVRRCWEVWVCVVPSCVVLFCVVLCCVVLCCVFLVEGGVGIEGRSRWFPFRSELRHPSAVICRVMCYTVLSTSPCCMYIFFLVISVLLGASGYLSGLYSLGAQYSPLASQ